MHRAFILADDEIGLQQLPTPSPLGAAAAEIAAGGDAILQVKVGSSIADAERRLILATLDACEGNKDQAAKILGISLKTLYNRLNSYKNIPVAGRAERSPHVCSVLHAATAACDSLGAHARTAARDGRSACRECSRATAWTPDPAASSGDATMAIMGMARKFGIAWNGLGERRCSRSLVSAACSGGGGGGGGNDNDGTTVRRRRSRRAARIARSPASRWAATAR